MSEINEINEIALRQTAITEEVHRLWTNFKKDGATRYSVEYFSQRLERLEQYWVIFQKNNHLLEDLRSANPQHEYFTKMYFNQLKVRYLEIKDTLNKKLDEERTKIQPSFELPTGTQKTTLPTEAASTDKGRKKEETLDNNECPKKIKSNQQESPSAAASNVEGRKKEETLDNNECPTKFKKLNLIRKNFQRIIQNVDFNQTPVYYGFKLDQLRDCWAKLTAINEEIMLSLEDADYNVDYVANCEFIDLEQAYQEAYIQLREAEKRGQQEAAPASTRMPHEIKLPAISIPEFSGKYEEWTSFWELFERLVHQNRSLSDVERIQYLKSSLRGEAARIVNHLSPTSNNYKTAIELLTKRFQNPAALVNKHIQNLLALKPVRFENAFDLKNLMDTAREILYGINNLGVDVKSWDPLVIQLLYPKLDADSKKLYQQSRGSSTEIPKLSEFFDFIEGRFRGLEDSSQNNREHQQQTQKPAFTKTHLTTVSQLKCVACNESHQLFQCKRFLSMSPKSRSEVTQKSGLCFNCLRDGHAAKECPSRKGCRTCGNQHHSLLHFPRAETASTTMQSSDEIPSTTTGCATACTKKRIVLLSTAMVNICVRGQVKPVRALIDQGSQSCIVTETLARQLKIPLTKYKSTVNGINGHVTPIISVCNFNIQSIHDERVNLMVEALVMPSITSKMPGQQFTPSKWPHIQGLRLADPWYAEPKDIELLIGSDILPQFLTEGLVKGPVNTPMAQNSICGWILSGPVVISTTGHQVHASIVTSCVSVCSEDEGLKKFWELEEVPDVCLKSVEEEMCETHYKMTHRRDKAGRYIVKLPLLKDRTVLGDSRKMALKRLFLLEQRFAKNEKLRQEYTKFIDEYISLGHMEEAPQDGSQKSYYLPHHAVMKEHSTTTNLRVVFDASAKTTSGESLNSIMMTGPTIQRDLFLLLLQWRSYSYVFTADVEKMYRQILVDQEDQNLQRILWRENACGPIKEYVLKTVIYGTASAPYLAIKTLCQLAEDEEHNYPLASKAVLEGFYVDDCLGGASSLKDCKELQQQLTKLLQDGGFNLRKWTSNSSEFLKALPEEVIEMKPEHDFNNEVTFKILGIKWCPSTDDFQFNIDVSSFSTENTKRSILSDAGKIFDPFGWLAPVTIKAKVLIQKLWLSGIKWDDEAPTRIQDEWNEFKTRLLKLDEVRIPRWTRQSINCQTELHGFADASESAYAAVVYQKVINGSSSTISLIASKTKVAPIKQVSLARLELCAAALLTKLMKYIQEGTDTNYTRIFAWTDSTIVLNWLQQHPVKWNTFVANRVSYVQQHSKGRWRFVPGKENPADIPSRGSFGDSLVANSRWWHGPEWLEKDEHHWPVDKSVIDAQEMPEVRKNITCMAVQCNNEDHYIFLAYSSLSELRRTSAYCLRFMNNCRKKIRAEPLQLSSLTVEELIESDKALVRGAQQSFAKEIDQLIKDKAFKSSSKISSLNPFVDANGILRVGGRLKHANLSTDQKHPMILPSSHPFTKLIVKQTHIDTLHGGVRLALNHIRRKFWIIRGTNTVKAIINQCVKCFRFKVKETSQLMGQLPDARVNFSRPFTHCGVDYAGPINIRCSQLRGVRSHKAYIAIFVCMATKAVHIELTSDLTTDGFMAALRRMISRRGAVNHL